MTSTNSRFTRSDDIDRSGMTSAPLDVVGEPEQMLTRPLSRVSSMWGGLNCWQVTDRAGLDSLPVGTEMRDVQGWRLVKTGEHEYRTYLPDLPGNPKEQMPLDTDEVLGTYSGETSAFLPATIVEPDQRLNGPGFPYNSYALAHQEDVDALTERVVALEEMLRNTDGAAMHDSGRIDRLEKKVRKIHRNLGGTIGAVEGLTVSAEGITRILEGIAKIAAKTRRS